MTLGTQWRFGATGPTGLDYGVIPDVLRMTAAPDELWPDLFASIRVMEDAALKAIHEKD